MARNTVRPAIQGELDRRHPRPDRQMFTKIVSCLTFAAVLMVLWQNRSIGEVTTNTNQVLHAHEAHRERDQDTLRLVAEKSVAQVVAALIGVPYAD